MSYQNESVLPVNSSEAWRSLRTDARSSIGRILDAARRLLGGHPATTLNKVASEAGVGIATLYRHFPNRQTLARAVLDRMFDEEAEPLLQEFCAGDVSREDLLTVTERFVEILQRERGVVHEVGNPADVVAHFLTRDARLTEAFARARVAGTLRPDLEADDLPVLLATLTTGPGLMDVEPRLRRRYLSLLLDGLNPAAAVPLPPREPVAAALP